MLFYLGYVAGFLYSILPKAVAALLATFLAVCFVGLARSIRAGTKTSARHYGLPIAVIFAAALIDVVYYRALAEKAAKPFTLKNADRSDRANFKFCLVDKTVAMTTDCGTDKKSVSTISLSRATARPWEGYTAAMLPQSEPAIYFGSTTSEDFISHSYETTFKVIIAGAGERNVARCAAPPLPNPFWMSSINIGRILGQRRVGYLHRECVNSVWRSARVRLDGNNSFPSKV
jgi:hypothetical protein